MPSDNNKSNIRALCNALIDEFNSSTSNNAKCAKYITKLKLLLSEHNFLVPPEDSPENSEILLLSRDVLEIGAQLSIRCKDIPSFERYISQLKAYYYDFGQKLSPSSKMYPLLGMNLLQLLMKNRISEFHTELELIGPERLENPYIKYPIKIEHYLTEGSYNKVWKSWDEVPAKEYLFFMETLSLTIRDEIAHSIEKAYKSLPISGAAVLMYLKSSESVYDFVKKYNWDVDETTKDIRFKSPNPDMEFPVSKKIGLLLKYTRELERIV